MIYRKYMSNPKTLFYIDTNDIVPNIKDIVKDKYIDVLQITNWN